MYFTSPRLQKGLFFPRTLPFSPSGTYFPVRRRVEDDNFLRKYCHTKSQENVPGMAHRIGVPATTSHASEEEKCLTRRGREIAKAVKAGMAFRPFLCDIIHDDPIPWVMITQNK